MFHARGQSFSSSAIAVSFTLGLIGPAQINAADIYQKVDTGVSAAGQFTAHNGALHYWTASGGYQVYDTAAGSATTIGPPPNGTTSNGYGDAFGVLDPANNLFYAGAYASGSRTDVYTYDGDAGAWQTPGPDGVSMINGYGAQAYDDQLYVSGLAEPWNGGRGQDNYIFAFDHAATPGSTPRHDTLIETAGNSAHLAIAPNGDIYYGTYSNDTLYRWTADQVAGVTDELYQAGATDTFLTIADAVDAWSLPGGGNGITVDDGGNVFFTTNNFSGSGTHVLGMLDETKASGYRELYATTGFADWFGAISVEGDFEEDGTLYFSPGGGIQSMTTVPEPGSLALLGAGALLTVGRRRRRNARRGGSGRAALGPRGVAIGSAVAAGVVMLSGAAHAGPFSPGKGGEDESAFVDAGIAGFVGPAGEGVTADNTNANVVNPVFQGWATGYSLYDPSDRLGPYEVDGIGTPPEYGANFGDPMRATGAVTGNNIDAVSLGDMDESEIAAHRADPIVNRLGTLDLTFDRAITNGAGADFAAFENGFVSNYSTGAGSVSGQMFAELGYVEVSTDGENYARFPSQYLNYPDGEGLPGATAYLTQDVSNVYNLVGKHSNAYGESWGTPFDLDDLTDHELVEAGLLDLDEVNHVRIIDIPGNGAFTDAEGNSIYDAWLTWGSGGMDFEALGVVNQVPEPTSLMMLAAGAGLIATRRRRG